MAIAKMEKLELSVKVKRLDDILQLIQSFQDIQIETDFDSTIPQENKAVIDREIRTIEKNLQEIHSALAILKGREKSKPFSSLRYGEEKKLSIAELTRIVEESDWESIFEEVIQTDRRLKNNRTRRQEIIDLLGTLELWEHVNSNPVDFKKLNRAKALFGSVHEKHAPDFTDGLAEFQNDGLFFERVADKNDRSYLLIIYHHDLELAVNSILNEFSFSSEEYPFMAVQAKARAELEAEEAQLIREEIEIGKMIVEKSVYSDILKFAEDHNLNILLRKKKSLEITYDGDDLTIVGWIVSERRALFEKMLSDNIPGDEYSLIFRQVGERDLDKVPIKLRNNRLVTIYERLTEMFSLPRYNELDPTPVMTVFYLLFFGLMISDIGYGLAVFGIGLLVKRVFKVKRSTKSFMEFLYYLSFPTIAWGLVFGAFFGIELPFGIISIRVNIIEMTVMSIILGYLHIMTGLVLRMINQARIKRYANLVTGGLSWFLAFLGGGLMILTAFVPMFDNGFIFWPGFVLTMLGLGLIVIGPAVVYSKRWYAGIGKGLYSLYGAMNYLGDFVSYTRLMALGVAGGSVANAFNTILAFLPLPAKVTLGVVLAIGLHALIIFLSMLSAYVHGIRLQFIEFFNKFYTGGGRKFEPFKAAEKNVIITDI